MGEAAHPLALVVDDEELLRLFAAGLLEEHGFDVLGAENAAVALRVLESLALNVDLAREVHARWPNVFLVVLLDKQSRVAPRFRMMAVLSGKPYGRRSCSPRSTT
jgi:CheY-like chemotaxis protein